ncbi:MAG: hypothetical protein M1813_007721 [Trichoglossum hirsutum]|nr:MAG: hypothetical protein M1813_007721 [Trichoglossum hirsutum]
MEKRKRRCTWQREKGVKWWYDSLSKRGPMIKGQTAPHEAASNGREEAVQELLKKGADITARNNDKKTAKELAAENARDVCKNFQATIIDFTIDRCEYHHLEQRPAYQVLYEDGPEHIMKNAGIAPISGSPRHRSEKNIAKIKNANENQPNTLDVLTETEKLTEIDDK